MYPKSNHMTRCSDLNYMHLPLLILPSPPEWANSAVLGGRETKMESAISGESQHLKVPILPMFKSNYGIIHLWFLPALMGETRLNRVSVGGLVYTGSSSSSGATRSCTGVVYHANHCSIPHHTLTNYPSRHIDETCTKVPWKHGGNI